MSESQSPIRSSTLIILPVIALLLFSVPSIVTEIADLAAFKDAAGVGQALLLSLLVPVIGAVVAVIGLVKAEKARRRLKAEQAVKGFGVVYTSLVSGVLLSLVGLIFTGATVWFVVSDIPKPNHPFGKTEISYYGQPDYNETALTTILLPDSTFLMGASRGLINANDNLWDGILLKTNLDGKEIFTKVIPGSQRPKLTVTSDGVILAAMLGAEIEENGSRINLVEMQKLTLNCDSLTSRVYAIGKEPNVSEIRTLRDGNCIVMGATQIGTLPMTWLFKVDQNGDSLWLKFYPKPAKSFFGQIIELKDGGLAMVGLRPIPVNGEPGNEEYLYAVKVDANGNIVWDNSKTDEIRGGGADVLEMEDGKLLILANDWYAKDGPETKLITLYADGSLDSEKALGGGGCFFYYSFIPWQNGEYLAAGWTPKRDPYYKMTMAAWDTYEIAIFTSDGKVTKGFQGGREMLEAWGVMRLTDNSCIITGIAYRDEAVRTTMKKNQDIGIIRFTM